MKSRKSPRRRSYSRFLQNVKPANTTNTTVTSVKHTQPHTTKQIYLKPPDTPKRNDIKIIRRPTTKKSKNRFTRKSRGKLSSDKDINNIEKQIALISNNKSVSSNTSRKNPEEPSKASEPVVTTTKPVVTTKAAKPDLTAKAKPVVTTKAAKSDAIAKTTNIVSKDSSKVHSSSRKHRSTLRKKQRGKRHHKQTNGRSVSIRKKRVKPEDIERIETKILSIRNKSSKDIREELSKEGIQVSGKSNRLLKDIYFYSKVCNINIKHEA